MILTLRLCVLYGSQNKQRLLPYTTLADWFCITELESVYSAVRTQFLYKKQTRLVFKGLKYVICTNFPHLSRFSFCPVHEEVLRSAIEICQMSQTIRFLRINFAFEQVRGHTPWRGERNLANILSRYLALTNNCLLYLPFHLSNSAEETSLDSWR